MFSINRQKLQEEFDRYVAVYEEDGPKVRLKADHSKRVADLCEAIARSEGFSDADCDLAWAMGMLHDIGRFEQIRRYGTFIDANSVSHAEFGADLLFGGAGNEVGTTGDADDGTAGAAGEGGDGREGRKGLIRRFLPDASEDILLEQAIRQHSALALEEGMSPRAERFANLLRDADKIDILRVNVESALMEIYDVTDEEMRASTISDAVLGDVLAHRTVDRRNVRTPMDRMVNKYAFVFGYTFAESYRLTEAQGYLQTLLNFPVENPETIRRMEIIRAEVNGWMAAHK